MSSGSITLPLTGTGNGSVTSVDVSGGSTGLTTSGGPITTSGTITIAGTVNIAHGGTGQVTASAAFGALSPLTTKGDILSFSTVNARLPVGTNNQILLADSTQATGLRYANNLTSTGITIDGAGLVLAAGLRGVITVPYNGTITAWTLLADQVGSIVVDIWKTDYAGYPGSVANTIVGSDPPTLTAVQKNRNLTLSAWTSTTITAGDILYFNVNSATTVTRVNLVLTVMKT